MDQELRYREHAAKALSKGEKWAQGLSRINKVATGIPVRYARQLYTAVVIPRVLYAADVFCCPSLHVVDGKVVLRPSPHVKRLARVQRSATISITGALRSSPSSLLDAHANLLPFHLTIEKICARTAVRLSTLPSEHPIYNEVRKAANHIPRHHRSPLHSIFHGFDIDPKPIEKITHHRRPPTWTPPQQLRFRIARSKEEAVEEEERCRDAVKIYGDGSGFEGGIGGAAVVRCGGRWEATRRFYLGKTSEHTVFEGELVGLILGIHLANVYGRFPRISLFVDNQAAIKALQEPKARAGHHLVDAFYKQLEQLLRKRPRLAIVIHWVPGHVDVEGNERADEEAKAAAMGRSSQPTELPAVLRRPLAASASAVKQHTLTKLKTKARNLWKKSPRARRMNQIDSSFPGPSFTKLVDKLPRQQASLLMQLRTGHVALNQHLHRINRSPTPRCPSCNNPNSRESVEHFLIHCPAHRTARAPLLRRLSHRNLTTRTLLSNRKYVKDLMHFIHATGRFKSTFPHLLHTFDDPE